MSDTFEYLKQQLPDVCDVVSTLGERAFLDTTNENLTALEIQSHGVISLVGKLREERLRIAA